MVIVTYISLGSKGACICVCMPNLFFLNAPGSLALRATFIERHLRHAGESNEVILFPWTRVRPLNSDGGYMAGDAVNNAISFFFLQSMPCVIGFQVCSSLLSRVQRITSDTDIPPSHETKLLTLLDLSLNIRLNESSY